MVDARTNILLTGAVDGIFRRLDGSYLLVDYKTARLTEQADRLFPMYEVQLNSYALVAEAVGIAPVTRLALVYTEPLTETPRPGHGTARSEHLAMGFKARILDVPLNRSLIAPLLASVRLILDVPAPPPGRAGCKECARREWLRANS